MQFSLLIYFNNRPLHVSNIFSIHHHEVRNLLYMQHMVYIILKLHYEERLISNAHSEVSRKRDHVFKQTKVGSKVQYFIYKLTYLFFDIVALSFNTFFPT